jgi:hypothetical protein
MWMRFRKDRAVTAAADNSIVANIIARILPRDLCACPVIARFASLMLASSKNSRGVGSWLLARTAASFHT